MSAVVQAHEPSTKYVAHAEPTLVRAFEVLTAAPNGVASLREMILSLAVQGKLAQQDRNEEPAAALLLRIAKAAGRCKPELEADLPLPGWIRTKFGEYVLELCTGPFGSLIGKSEYVVGGVPLVNPSHMKNGRIEAQSSISVSAAKASQLKAYTLAAGDVVFARRGEVGRTALVTDYENGWLCGTGSFFARLHADIDRAYLQMIFNSPSMRAYLGGAAVGATMVNLNQRVLLNAPMDIPPVSEQHRIVARVDELMKLCDSLEQCGRMADEQHVRLTSTLFDALAASESAHALAENWQRVSEHFDVLLDRPEAIDALERTTLLLAVRGLLEPQIQSDGPALALLARIAAARPPKRGTVEAGVGVVGELTGALPFEIPIGWAWARFDDIAGIVSNLVQPAQHPNAWQIGPDCIEKGTGRLISRRTVEESGVISANHSFVAGQILYSKIRPSLSKAVIVNFAGLCSADMYPIEASIVPKYLLLVMLSQVFLDQVKEAENRVKMPKLNQEALNAFVVPIPPLAEQHRIVARVQELRHLCATLRQRLTQSREIQSRLADALVAEVA